MKQFKYWLTSAALLASYAPSARPYMFHPTNFEDHGVCPFECCRYREWTVKKDTPIRTARTENAPVVFTAKKNDTVNGLTGVVITDEAGEAKLLKAMTLNDEPAKKDETVYLLTPLGKDIYKIWYRGKRVRNFEGMSNLKIIRRPTSIWWVKIGNKKGQTGWSNQPDHFDNKGACDE